MEACWPCLVRGMHARIPSESVNVSLITPTILSESVNPGKQNEDSAAGHSKCMESFRTFCLDWKWQVPTPQSL